MEMLIYRGYEYADADAAKAVFERANETLKDCSVWRTATQDLSRWFVLGIFAPDSGIDTFDWAVGAEFAPAPEQIEWMVNRRRIRAARALVLNEEEVNEVRRYTPEDDIRIPSDGVGRVHR